MRPSVCDDKQPRSGFTVREFLMIDEASLTLFLRVAKLRGVTAAARDLGVSPAAASARVMALERAVGARLFHRTTRAVSLSPDGEAFLPFAEAALEAIAGGRAATGGAGAQAVGLLRMTAPGSFARAHMMPLIPEFLARHPGVRLDLRLSDVVLDLVEGSFDLAVRDAPLADSGLIARKLAPDRRLLAAAPALAARLTSAGLDALAQAPCIAVARHDRWRFATGQTVRVDPVLRVDDGAAALSAAMAGVGVAVMSLWLAGDALRDGRLVPVLPDHRLADEAAIWAVHPSGRMTPLRTRAMIDFLVEAFALPPWEDAAP
jgi:DNA-binding transcriptional LysR family regulator